MGEPMKKIFSRKTLIVVVIALIVALAAVISMVGTGKPGFVTSAVETLLKPVKSASAAVAGTCEKLYGYMHDYDRLIGENAALRARLAGADREARDYDALEEENVRLRELLGLSRKSEDYEYESASIIAWSASSWDSTFTINKGSANSDVSPGDPVITSSGCVVGLVRTVSASSSVCASLIDTTFAVSVDLDNVSGSCSAVGDYALMRQGKLMVEYISDSNRVFAGDSVITSGKGGLFPADLLVGYVDMVTATSDGQNDVAVVSPAVSLDDLLYVYVITDFSMTE